jgi:ABC-type transporter Mla subunit MlaD
LIEEFDLAQSGNGIDLGAVYRLLTEVAETVRTHSVRLDQLLAVVNEHSHVLNDHTRVLNDHSRVLNDHSRQLDDLNASVASLRADVGLYHEAVTSQGIHYSDLEDRVRRVERHLKLEPGE